MIAIVGSAHDDILYFESIMNGKKKEVIFDRFEVITGMIFNQEALLLCDLYTSVLSASLINYILNQYYISLIICVGKCISISDTLKDGDIIISNRVVDVNCDLTTVQNVGLGQIPGFDRIFTVQNDVITYMLQGVNKRTYASSTLGTFLSSDNLSDDTLRFLKEKKMIFGENSNLVFDSNSAGVALSCILYDTPFLIVKVIERTLDKSSDVDTYLKVLDSYISLGKAVVSMIGDIGRKDILKGGVRN